MAYFHYMIVINHGDPLIIVRVPVTGKPGKRKHVPKWRDMLADLTPVMQSHGLKKKDISALDNLSHPNDWEPDLERWDAKYDPYAQPEMVAKARALLERIEHAFEGDPEIFPKFWLYGWTPSGFVLLREPSER